MKCQDGRFKGYDVKMNGMFRTAVVSLIFAGFMTVFELQASSFDHRPYFISERWIYQQPVGDVEIGEPTIDGMRKFGPLISSNSQLSLLFASNAVVTQLVYRAEQSLTSPASARKESQELNKAHSSGFAITNRLKNHSPIRETDRIAVLKDSGSDESQVDEEKQV